MSIPKVKLKDIKIKVRIQQSNGWYFGEVFKPEIVDDKNLLYYMNCNLKNGWNKVTDDCYTRWGCKHAIKNWKKRHFIEILEM